MNENEKKQAGASYILTFYNQILAINDAYSSYLNFLVELEFKYGKEFNEKASEEEKNAIISTTRQLRYLIINSYIQYTTIKSAIKIKVDDANYKIVYNKLAMNYTLKRNDLEEYVLFLNTFLINNIIQELLTTSADYLSKIYKENDAEN